MSGDSTTQGDFIPLRVSHCPHLHGDSIQFKRTGGNAAPKIEPPVDVFQIADGYRRTISVSHFQANSSQAEAMRVAPQVGTVRGRLAGAGGRIHKFAIVFLDGRKGELV